MRHNAPKKKIAAQNLPQLWTGWQTSSVQMKHASQMQDTCSSWKRFKSVSAVSICRLCQVQAELSRNLYLAEMSEHGCGEGVSYLGHSRHTM